VYNGGAGRWTADGHALTADAAPPEPSDYRAGPADDDIRTTWQYVMDHTNDPSTLMCENGVPSSRRFR
jgi:hypothetical protein